MHCLRRHLGESRKESAVQNVYKKPLKIQNIYNLFFFKYIAER